MEITYTIGLYQDKSELDKGSTEIGRDMNLSVLEGNLYIDSDPHPFMSSRLYSSSKIKGDYLKYKGNIYGYSDNRIKEVTKEQIIENPSKYPIKLIKNNKLPLNLSPLDTLYIFKLEGDSLVEIDNYTVKYKDSSISGLESDAKYFYYLSNASDKEIVKSDKSLTLNEEQVLKLLPGFYMVLAGVEGSEINVEIFNNKLYLDNKTSLTSITSNFNVNIDGVSTNSYHTLPNTSLEMSYTKDDLTPLVGVEEFEKDNEYIIFELIAGTYVPKFYLKSTGEGANNAEFKRLMASHSEFKRKYSVLAKRVKIKIAEDFHYLNNLDFLSINVENLPSINLTPPVPTIDPIDLSSELETQNSRGSSHLPGEY